MLLLTVGLTTARNCALAEWPKFTFRNFNLCRTWLLPAGMVSGVRRVSEHITPILEDQHWLGLHIRPIGYIASE